MEKFSKASTHNERAFETQVCHRPAPLVRHERSQVTSLPTDEPELKRARPLFATAPTDSPMWQRFPQRGKASFHVRSNALMHFPANMLGLPVDLIRSETKSFWHSGEAKTDFERMFDAACSGVQFQNADLPSRLSKMLRFYNNPAQQKIGDELQKQLDGAIEGLTPQYDGKIGMLRWARDNWHQLVDGPLLKHVRTIIILGIVAGFLDESYSELEYNAVKVFAVNWREHDAFQLVDMALQAFTYFVEAVYSSWETGSLTPFLFEKSTAFAYDRAYTSVVQLHHLVKTYDSNAVEVNFPHFLNGINQTITMYASAIPLCSTTALTHIYEFRLKNLQKIMTDVLMRSRAGALSRQPMCVSFYGRPGCGKSRLMTATMHLHEAINGRVFDQTVVADVTTDDKYDSNISNRTRIVRMDDIANRPTKADPGMACAKILQIVNNVPFVATKADVDDKGNVMPNVELVVCSTNNPDMHFSELSVEPNSLRRRVMRVDVEVKREYRAPHGGVDITKALRAPTMQIQENIFQLVQTFTINTVDKNGFTPRYYTHPDGTQTLLANLEIYDFFHYLELLMEEHQEDQDRFLDGVRDMRLRKCNCGRVICKCEAASYVPIFPAPEASSTADKEGSTGRLRGPQPMPEPPPPLALSEEPKMTPLTYADLLREVQDYVNNEIPDPDRQHKINESLEVENQAMFGRSAWGYLADAITKRATASAKFFAGPVAEYFDMYDVFGFRKEWTAKTIADWAFTKVECYDPFQWWYWVPAWLWDTDFARALSETISAPELTKKRRRHVRRIWYGASLFLLDCVLTPFVTRAYWMRAGPEAMKPGLFAVAVSLWSMNDQAPLKALLLYCATGLYYAGKIGFAVSVTAKVFEFLLIEDAYKYLTERRDVINQAAEREREKFPASIKIALGLGTVAIAGAAILTICSENVSFNSKKSNNVDTPAISVDELDAKNERPTTQRQSFLCVTEDAIQKRNAVVNAWERNSIRRHRDVSNRTQTPAQFESMIVKNMTSIYSRKRGEKEFSFLGGALWVAQNFLLVPYHYIDKNGEEFDWMAVDRTDCPSSSSYQTVSKSTCRRHDKYDLCLVHMTTRSRRSIVRYFESQPHRLVATYLWHGSGHQHDGKRLPDLWGQRSEAKIHAKQDPNHPIWQWSFPEETRVGMCGGVYLDLSDNPSILGIHTSGSVPGSEKSYGFSVCPSQEWLTDCMHSMVTKHKLLPPPMDHDWGERLVNGSKLYYAGVRHNNEYDLLQSVDYLQKQAEKAATDVEVEKQGALYVGKRNSGAFFKSRVIPTISAAKIAKRLQMHQAFGPPRFGSSMYAKSAMYTFDCTPGFPQDLLTKAVHDYLHPYLNSQLPPSLDRHLRPLSVHEAVNGKDGVRFIDPMNFATSMGANYPGGKKAWIEELTMIDGDSVRVFKDGVLDDVYTVINLYNLGCIANLMFTMVPKDEPTPVDKEKVRLFAVGEIACTIIMRMYGTPLARLLQMTTVVSECAVGMNATSYDWEEAMQHLCTFGNRFDGDYSKYDLRMPAQVNMASWRVLIELAACGGYTPDDLNIMNMLAHDVTSPLYAYQQQVYQVHGSTPSGIPLTVILNSLNGSLLVRMGFFSMYPTVMPGNFRKYVKLLTYGDDMLCSVGYWYSRFHFASYQKFLAKYKIVFTPGDKTDTSYKYLPWNAPLVFLKRSSSSGFKFRVGKLDTASIHKCLVSVLESKELTPAEAIAINIDTALREYALHGPREYERFRLLIMDIAKEDGYAHLCRELHKKHSEIMAEHFPDL